MQVGPPHVQILNQCKLCHMGTQFATDASGVIWWPNLQLMQVALSGGQICNECKWHHPLAKFATLECKWCHVVAKFSPSYGVNFWVRCASGNVLNNFVGKIYENFELEDNRFVLTILKNIFQPFLPINN